MTRPDHYSAFYSDKFYKGHHSDSAITSARKIVSVLKEYLTFESVIDIGCKVGQNLMDCCESGAKIIRGVDGSWVNQDLLMIPKECFTQYDLSQPNIKAAITEQHFVTSQSLPKLQNTSTSRTQILSWTILRHSVM